MRYLVGLSVLAPCLWLGLPAPWGLIAVGAIFTMLAVAIAGLAWNSLPKSI